MSYLLDSDVLIRAKNLHYGFDFCPGFWDWSVTANTEGLVFSIGNVRDEICAVEDELANWARGRGDGFFLKATPEVLDALGTVVDWVAGQSFQPSAINTFLQAADCYLVAHALAGGYTVVTHEVASQSKKKVKIPNVCMGVGVAYLTPFEMLRREQPRFVLEVSK